jgi:Protein of unknown function (DUF5672)
VDSKKSYDVFYSYGRSAVPPVAAVGKSMNIYELQADAASSASVNGASDATTVGAILSSYNALMVRDNQAGYDAYVAVIQPSIIDLVKDKKSIPTIKHIQMHGCSKLGPLGDLVIQGAFSDPFRRFSSLALPLLQKKFVSIAAKSSSSEVGSNVAVIVEPQIVSTFETSVRNVMYHLGPQWSLVVVHSKLNEAFVKAALADIATNIQFVQSSVQLNTIADYNAMMKSAAFWRSLNADKALVFQSDSIMLSSGIEAYMKYDFIGAPWDLDHNMYVKALFDKGDLVRGVGNGGFSLRSVKAMIAIAEAGDTDTDAAAGSSTSSSSPDEAEDIFFSRHLDKADSQYAMPTRRVAYSFCRKETILALELIEGQSWPLALHSTWKNSASQVTFTILNDYLKSLSDTNAPAVLKNTYSFSGKYVHVCDRRPFGT